MKQRLLLVLHLTIFVVGTALGFAIPAQALAAGARHADTAAFTASTSVVRVAVGSASDSRLDRVVRNRSGRDRSARASDATSLAFVLPDASPTVFPASTTETKVGRTATRARPTGRASIHGPRGPPRDR